VTLNSEIALVIKEGLVQGNFLSEVLPVPQFTDVVASWNSLTPQGSFVELSIKVKSQDTWSQWFSYGKWSDNGLNLGSIKGQQDDVALLETDLLRVQQGHSDAIQFKLDLYRKDPGAASPSVRLVGFSWTPLQKPEELYISANIKLDVSPRAQLPVPEIGSIICSPTSLATVMAYHGHVETTEQVAAGARDNGANIYGNWSYNVAYAGEKGFTAWVERCNSLKDVKNYLNQGLPIIASIRIKDKAELEGALSAYSSGHLLVIVGLAHRDGQDYVLVNDPAAHRDEDVPREYRYDQFTRAWTKKRIYVLTK
jgi:hypothetical protein